jgi:hypothetical protein
MLDYLATNLALQTSEAKRRPMDSSKSSPRSLTAKSWTLKSGAEGFRVSFGDLQKMPGQRGFRATTAVCQPTGVAYEK